MARPRHPRTGRFITKKQAAAFKAAATRRKRKLAAERAERKRQRELSRAIMQALAEAQQRARVKEERKQKKRERDRRYRERKRAKQRLPEMSLTELDRKAADIADITGLSLREVYTLHFSGESIGVAA